MKDEQAAGPRGVRALYGFWAWTGHGRYLSQVLFLGLTVFVTVQMVSGVRGATIERYCPFGGVETLIPWLRKTGTLCSLSTLNISMLLGLLVMTLLFKRVFCSHICPVGTILEVIGKGGRRFLIGTRRVPGRLDRALKGLKYSLMVLIVILTIQVGELVFRDFDPYYVIFTAGRGHGIGTYGVWVTLAVLLAGVLVPLSFCKYLCPLAACMGPFGRLGLVRVFRDEESCTDCGSCDAACEWGIKVSEMRSVTSAECSNCQDCIRKCPVPGTLELRGGRARS